MTTYNVYGEPLTRTWRLIEWIDDHTGKRLPWGGCYVFLRRCVFGMPSGTGGFWLALPLPRWLPGFVKDYQMDEIRTRAGRKETDLSVIIPLLPLGWWTTSRTRRWRNR